MKLFVNGRKHVFEQLAQQINPADRIIWLHAASLGEYEQGVPVLEELKKTYPRYKILVTFFSPSGYEVKKNSKIADYVSYLPLDTQKNVFTFLKIVQPKLAIFVKYEIWPNYLRALKESSIPTLLISGNFRREQIYFRSFTDLMKNALHCFNHLFVQNESSVTVLKNNDFTKVTKSGDTRFDRVSKQLEMNNRLDFITQFKGENLCVVGGSTWPEDEALLVDYINKAPKGVKFILAPHQIKPQHITGLQRKLTVSSLLYSDKEGQDLRKFSVLIIDTIGLLTKIYAYADVAYVGGAAGKTGLHNILEPAAFGVPIIIGKNYNYFPEAKMLLRQEGLFSVNNAQACSSILERLVTDANYRQQIGENSRLFVQKNKGATKIIMTHIARRKFLTK